MTNWQVQEAKQRFSEVLRNAHDEGPQIITRHGEEVAVVIDMSEYRKTRAQKVDFHDFLLAGPSLDDLDIERPLDEGRDVGFLEEM